MNRFKKFLLRSAAILAVGAGSVQAQNQYVGYVYPAGGQQGSTFAIRLGGQQLAYPSGLVVTGEGVSVRLVDHYRVMNNQELQLLRKQERELKKKETTLSDAMTEQMAWFEFPATVEPAEASGLVCPACGVLNPLDATVCGDCYAALPKPKHSKPEGAAPTANTERSEKDLAKSNLLERMKRIFVEDQRNASVPAHRELVFAEVTIAPNAKPGRREIRVITKRGLSNALPFYVGQWPEIARKPMKTWQKPVLGKESLAQRKRPAEEIEYRISLPCTMNGQIAAGEVNQYRFRANKGQKLVVSCKARELIPYVADGVPGWFQAVLRLHDSNGNEVAYNDDYRFNPDPTILFEVPEDGEYVLTINEAIFRGRESFTYRITIGERPFISSIFPLGGPVGEKAKVTMDGWNLTQATLTLPSSDATPGKYLVAATAGKKISNYIPFALDTLPECLDKESNNEISKAQKVTLPIIVNGRSDHPGDWDVFEIEGKTGETIVTEVKARRLGSPFDSFVKITTADGNVIALNDDHMDAASGLDTDYADSYLMTKLPSDGTYYIHIGDTRQHAGKEYAYRLRISRPRPDFELRVVPSRIIVRGKKDIRPTVYAIRRDGFSGPIKLGFTNLPKGIESPGATLPADQNTVKIKLTSTLAEMDAPINVTLLGTATVGDQELVRKAVPAEDRMQAFLWRHLLCAEDLPLFVYDGNYKPPMDRIRPPIRDEDRPKDVKRTLRKSTIDRHLSNVNKLYQAWLLTDEFANREIAAVESKVIQ